jgi:hypothetical protein
VYQKKGKLGRGRIGRGKGLGGKGVGGKAEGIGVRDAANKNPKGFGRLKLLGLIPEAMGLTGSVDSENLSGLA